MNNCIVADHPLIKHKLTMMRKKETSCHDFRLLLSELSMLLSYEVTRNVEMGEMEITTPLEKMTAPIVKNETCLISILRAGNGLLDGILKLLPTAKVGHVGLYRDPKTYEAVEYYFKLPKDLPTLDTIVVDPMLATGHSASLALTRIKESQPKSLKFVCLVAAPEGVKHLQETHPDVEIYTAAIDRELSSKNYILPGLGDAGDRIYATM